MRETLHYLRNFPFLLARSSPLKSGLSMYWLFLSLTIRVFAAVNCSQLTVEASAGDIIENICM